MSASYVYSARPSGLLSLPAEIVGIILKLLAEDYEEPKKLLSAAASLNKTSRKLTVPFLFESVKIKSSTSFHRFFVFLASRGNIAESIKYLTLEKKFELIPPRHLHCKSDTSVPELRDGPRLDMAALAIALDQLKSLRRLTLDELEQKTNVVFLSPVAQAHRPKLQELVLRGDVTLKLLSSLLSMVAPEVVRLENMNGDLLPLSEITMATVPNLVVAQCAAYAMPLLRHLICLETLCSLSVAINCGEHFNDLCALVWAAGGSLTAVDVDASQIIHLGTDKDEFVDESFVVAWTRLGQALEGCTQLISFRLVVPAKRTSDLRPLDESCTYDPRRELFSAIFASSDNVTRPRNISQVTLCFACTESDGEYHGTDRAADAFAQGDGPVLWDLPKLDDILTIGRKWPSLGEGSVKVELRLPDTREDEASLLQKAVKDALPGMSRASMLDFDVAFFAPPDHRRTSGF